MGRRRKKGRPSGRARGRSTGGRFSWAERIQTALVGLVLIGTGVLLGSFWIEWRGARLAESEPPPNPAIDALDELDNRPKVEVLNGTGERGAAATVGEILRERGFDVVAVDNADHYDHEVTHVLDRTGRPETARVVAEGLGVDSVASAPDPDLFLDATVILGADWRERIRRASGLADQRSR